METRSLAEKGVGAKTRCHKFIMINTSARRATRGRDATRRCIYLSLCARMTESDEIPKRDGRETRVYDFRTNRSPGGCCARVRINLRLLVKIRALSFHLCVRARELIRSFGCVQYACQGRVLVVLVGHLHKTPSKERSGTPVDFLPRERERERWRAQATLGILSRFICFGARKGNPGTHNLQHGPTRYFGDTCYLSWKDEARDDV